MKKTLLFSVILLMISLTGLIGSTYAWWSETIESPKNQISMGELDLKVEVKVPGVNKWLDLQEDYDKIFDGSQIDFPGSSNQRQVRITNDGTIPVKYRMSTVVDETNTLIPHIYFNFPVWDSMEPLLHGEITNKTSQFILIEPGEVQYIQIYYIVSEELGEPDGNYGENHILLFDIIFEAQQIAKADELEN